MRGLKTGKVEAMQQSFKDRQAKLVYFNSKEFKEAEKQQRQQLEREYWEDYNNEIDRMPDGSDEQPFEEE